MRSERAIDELASLKNEAERPEVMGGGEHLTAWKAKVRGVLHAALGADDHLIARFDAVRYSLRVYSASTPQERFVAARHGGI